jgi:hypothetical protein
MIGKTDQDGIITLGLITSWILGILYLLAGLAYFTAPKASVPFLLVALLLLPPIRRFLYQRTGKSLSKGARIVFVLVLIVIGWDATTPTASEVSSSSLTSRPAVPANQTQQLLYSGQPLENAQPENIFGALAKAFWFGGGSTDLQRQNAQEQIKGKVVQWSLPVLNIHRSEDDTYEVETKLDGPVVVDTSIEITPRNERDRQFLASLKIGDLFSFRGVIADADGGLAWHHLKIKSAILMPN